ncbi:MAG: DUF362 domain-containing protein, partial [Longimicrobiales bacterium]
MPGFLGHNIPNLSPSAPAPDEAVSHQLSSERMESKVAKLRVKPKPFLYPEYCKACGRCIEACRFGCIVEGTEINPETGLMPVEIDLEKCNACGLCVSACPEPFGLHLRAV